MANGCRRPMGGSFEALLNQFSERPAAMADGVLLRIGHLGGRAFFAGGLEAGIVAVTAATARRPHDAAIDRAVHQLDMLVRPRQCQHAMEGGGACRISV